MDFAVKFGYSEKSSQKKSFAFWICAGDNTKNGAMRLSQKIKTESRKSRIEEQNKMSTNGGNKMFKTHKLITL